MWVHFERWELIVLHVSLMPRLIAIVGQRWMLERKLFKRT
jgi:hypothetical protein